MNDFTLATRMFENAVDIKHGRAVAARAPRGDSSLGRALDEMGELWGAPKRSGRRRKQAEPVVALEPVPVNADQELSAARARWDAGDYAGAREILRAAGLELPQWPKKAIGSVLTRQMHPDVARALGLATEAPEAVSAPKQAIRKVKPRKWGVVRFVPIVGCALEETAEIARRQESLLTAITATAWHLQRGRK